MSNVSLTVKGNTVRPYLHTDRNGKKTLFFTVLANVGRRDAGRTNAFRFAIRAFQDGGNEVLEQMHQALQEKSRWVEVKAYQFRQSEPRVDEDGVMYNGDITWFVRSFQDIQALGLLRPTESVRAEALDPEEQEEEADEQLGDYIGAGGEDVPNTAHIGEEDIPF